MAKYRLEWLKHKNNSIENISWVLEISEKWEISWVIKDWVSGWLEIIWKAVKTKCWLILRISGNSIAGTAFCILYELKKGKSRKWIFDENILWDYCWEYINTTKDVVDRILSKTTWEKCLIRAHKWEKVNFKITEYN